MNIILVLICIFTSFFLCFCAHLIYDLMSKSIVYVYYISIIIDQLIGQIDHNMSLNFIEENSSCILILLNERITLDI